MEERGRLTLRGRGVFANSSTEEKGCEDFVTCSDDAHAGIVKVAFHIFAVLGGVLPLMGNGFSGGDNAPRAVEVLGYGSHLILLLSDFSPLLEARVAHLITLVHILRMGVGELVESRV